MNQTQERLTDLAARFTRAQEQLDAAVKQRVDEVSVFGVNFQDVSESVDALQRDCSCLYALRCRWYGVVAETVQD